MRENEGTEEVKDMYENRCREDFVARAPKD